MADLSLPWNADFVSSPKGGLALASGLTMSQQRVVRRLLTNPGAYITHPTYGGGLGRFVGKAFNQGLVLGVVEVQMSLEPTVESTQSVTVTPVGTKIMVEIVYTAVGENTPALLSFSISPAGVTTN